VVDLAGDHPDRDAIADYLLSLMQRTYYGKGSQSQVMLESIERAAGVERDQCTQPEQR
jgi:hypothetical protein